MKTLTEVERLKAKLIQVQARQRWAESGGSPKDWDDGLSDAVIAKLGLNRDGDLIGWDAAIAQPGIERHLDPDRSSPTVTTEWAAVEALRTEQGYAPSTPRLAVERQFPLDQTAQPTVAPTAQEDWATVAAIRAERGRA